MAIQKTEAKQSLKEAAKAQTKTQSPTNPVKMDQEDLNTLQELQTQTDKLVYSLGQLYINKEKLQKTENALKTQLKEIETKEVDLGKQLSSKYGVGTVDINTGTFTPRS